MSQLTLTDEKISIRAPFTSLTPAEKKIYNFLNSMGKGLTHNHIKQVLHGTGIQVFDNKLRSLRKKGWVESWKGPDDTLLYYAVPKEASG